jgi:hypothetical protein
MLNLCDILLHMNDTAGAVEHLREVFKVGLEINAIPMVLYALVMFGKVRHAAGQTDEGLRLIGLALGHPSALAEMRDEAERTTQAWGLDAAAIEQGLAAGRVMDFEATIQRLMEESV